MLWDCVCEDAGFSHPLTFFFFIQIACWRLKRDNVLCLQLTLMEMRTEISMHTCTDTTQTHAEHTLTVSLHPSILLSLTLHVVYFLAAEPTPLSSILQVLMEITSLKMPSHFTNLYRWCIWGWICALHASCLNENWQCIRAIRGVKSVYSICPTDREWKSAPVLTWK